MTCQTGIRVQQLVTSDYTDEQLLFLKQMGIDDVCVLFKDHHTDYDSVMRFVDRLHRFDLHPSDGGNRTIYKNPAIHLGLPGRDEGIDAYNAFSRILAKAGILVNYMTWEPNGVLQTRYGVGAHTRGAIGRIVDVDQLKTLPYSHGRSYSKEEMWQNYQYFLERVIPVCEELGMKIAIHPNDPPVPELCGISNLIISSDDYRKAIALADGSPVIGIKMCVGCWLEGGSHFGDVLKDIDEFVKAGRVLSVHFRNVSSPVPKFEETLIEDGYMDMYQVLRQFVKSGYQGPVSVDHVPEYVASCGGKNASLAYSNGYLKALLSCALRGDRL